MGEPGFWDKQDQARQIVEELKSLKAIIKPLEETIQAADCVIVVTDHSTIDYDVVGKNAKQVVDTRNALKKTRKTCA